MKISFIFSIMMLYTSTIHAQDEQPSLPTKKGAADAKVIATVLGKKIVEKDKEKLSGIIFGTLLDKFTKDNNIEPTDEEIATFLKYIDDSTKKNQIDYEERKQKLIQELKSTSLSKQERESKTKRLNTIESILKVYKDTQNEALGKEELLAMRSVAKSYIIRWKTNKALFKQYGGRVLFQQAGVEPIDAYRDYLKEQEKLGNFEIFDKGLNDQFWKYFLHPIKHFLSSGKKAENAINTPIWLMTDNADE